MVVDKGLSWSARDGFCFWGCVEFGGGDFDELVQRNENFLVGSLRGEAKPIGQFVSEGWWYMLQWTSRVVKRVADIIMCIEKEMGIVNFSCFADVFELTPTRI